MKKKGGPRSRSARDKGRKSLSANLEGTVPVSEAPVDFKPGEKAAAKRPKRPPGWKPRERYRGDMSIRVALPPGVKKDLPSKVTVIPAYRLYKYDKPDVQHSRRSSRDKPAEFKKIPESHYIVLVQIKGYRPFPSLVKFTKDTREIRITPVLHPVSGKEQEEELLRVGERHAYVTPVKNFLEKFGYLRKSSCCCEEDQLCDHISIALRRFQKNFRLNPLGSLTVETFLLMQRPRCAHPDVPAEGAVRSWAGPPGAPASDPIAFMGERWDTHSLRYRLMTGTGDISNEWNIIRESMNNWAQASPLTFTQTTAASSELEFDFRHPSESGYPFDRGGSKGGNTLAHAWGPYNGTVEFDDHEDWGDRSLEAVATHEIGHALGLHHSGNDDSTMYPWYDSGWDTLHEVDVRGIKSLYTPVYHHSGPFVRYPLFAFQSRQGTDSMTIDLGSTRHFLAWGSIIMIDSLSDFDRDNMCFIDVYEVDGNRSGWRISGGDHFGSANSPANAYEGARVGYGRRITFRITAGHVHDLEVAGYALVLVLDD